MSEEERYDPKLRNIPRGSSLHCFGHVRGTSDKRIPKQAHECQMELGRIQQNHGKHAEVQLQTT